MFASKSLLDFRYSAASDYNQLSPCGHLAITDTPLIWTAAESPPAKIIDIWLKQTPPITNLRTPFLVPKANWILLVHLSF